MLLPDTAFAEAGESAARREKKRKKKKKKKTKKEGKKKNEGNYLAPRTLGC